MSESFYAIYLHIPFCSVRCSYCAFNTYTDRALHISDYTSMLCKEINLQGRGEKVHTIYFGGGTPSLLLPAQLEKIISAIKKCFNVMPECETTLEVNPHGQIEWEHLREIGINRLSMGMQSAFASELTLFKRDHTFEDVVSAVQNARKAGFDNISLDLIYGIPSQTLQMWEYSLAQALALAPTHLSAYALELKPGTELTQQVKYGHLPEPDDDLTADMYELMSEKLVVAGFDQYEISNWSLPGRASRHNMQYWHNLPYLGLGAGAHGYIQNIRTVNVMRPEQYIKRLQSKKSFNYPLTPAIQSHEVISREQEMFETLMMGFRLLKEGISRQKFAARFGEPLDNRYGSAIERLKQRQLIDEENGTLFLTKSARMLSNLVFEELL